LQSRPRDTRKSMYETMYYTLKEKGVDAAVAHFSLLKRDHADEYEFDETTPAVIGYLLFNRGKYPEAIGFMHG
ncbi:MAG: hypothetical protein RugAbin2_02463, partial [Rugosibacter sp.]|nr:hypothetical protein [Rugosibacter sp.]